MKRFFARSLIVITLLSLFAVFFPRGAAEAQGVSSPKSTHTATPAPAPAPHAVAPHASGGGCRSVSSGNKTRYVSYSACISYFFFKVFPDGYVTFGAASPGLWQACRVSLYLYDRNNTYIDGRTFDCLSQARSNAVSAYFGFSDVTGLGSAYHTEMSVYYSYHPDGTGYYGPRISSPVQYT